MKIFHILGLLHYIRNERESIFFNKISLDETKLQGNRIKIPSSFCIRQCGEDIFTTMLTAGGNKWGIVCKKKSHKASRRVAYVIDF